MSDVTAALRRAFEEHEYEVAEVSRNRDRVRVVVLDDEADQAELEALTHEVVDPADVLGLNVTTETIDGQDVVGTVVSFRLRE